MLKFVRILTVSLPFSMIFCIIIYTLLSISSTPSILALVLLVLPLQLSLGVLIASASLVSPLSVILLFNNDLFSPDFAFKRIKLAIIIHFIYIILMLTHITNDLFTFIVNLLSLNIDTKAHYEKVWFAITFVLLLLPLINFFSIFKNRFTIPKEPSEDR